MTTAVKAAPIRAEVDWKRLLIIALCALTLLCLLFIPQLTAEDKSSGEALSLTGWDFLMGNTSGKSAGTPHPMVISTIIFTLMGIAAAWFNPDKFVYSIVSAIFLAVSVFMFRFDITYQSKVEFGFAKDSLVFSAGWMIAMGLAVLNLITVIWRKMGRTMALRREEIAATRANANIRSDYQVPTTWEIIKRDFSKHWPIYLLILPTIIFYIVWCYGPMYGILISFNNYKAKGGITGSEWVGLQWFRDFFRSAYAYRTIRNTLLISFYNLLVGFPAPIILALLLNEMLSVRYKRVVQTVTYMPYFISLVVMCGILTDFCSTTGLFAEIQKLFGVESPVNLLGEAKYFRTVYVGSELWQRLGWDSIIFLSALAGIDQEQYEAATIDGAGKFKQVIHVTIPGILPTISILLILRIGSLMGVGYEKIILLYNGLTYETADVVSTYVYRKGIVDANFSFSTAVNLFNSIINFLLVIFANKMSALLTENSLW